jgi:2-polyprenyl-3-methyl-5-hydroxy-6-metoxy-1,4-benzoquinol methylase
VGAGISSAALPGKHDRDMSSLTDTPTRHEYIRCPLCNDDKTRLHYKIDLHHVILSSMWVNGAEYPITEPETIVRCRTCGFIYVNPRVVFLPGALPYSIEQELAYFEHTLPARLLVCRNLVNSMPVWLGRKPLSLLDIGCGDGTLIEVARQAGIASVGFEISEAMIRSVRQRLGPGSIVTSDLADLPEGQYDAITLISVLEHVPDPHMLLRQARRLLKPDGMLLIEVPNTGGFSAWWRGARWDQIEPLAHLSYFTNRTLTAMLMQHGFQASDRFTMTPRVNLVGAHGITGIAKRIIATLDVYLGSSLGLVARPTHTSTASEASAAHLR